MYRAFNLTVKASQFEETYSNLFSIGSKHVKKRNKEVEPLLYELIDSDIIDGTQLSDNWFKSVSSDIFISYSHDDEELAMVLSGWLQKNFGLNVFLDKSIWGNADDLLKTIDNIYCKNENGSYNYYKRNFSTSHIHAMLCTAIMRVMDQSEVVLFLNTEHSVSSTKQLLEKKTEYTLSPWIYTEIMLSTVLRTKDWAEYRERALLEFAHESTGELPKLKIQYNIPTEQLTSINVQCLNHWRENYFNREDDAYGGIFNKNFDHPLNYLV